MNPAEGSVLKGLYLEGAAFKARIIDCLSAAGFAVHSVRHSGEFHVVQIPTPQHLLNPEAFGAWEKRHPEAQAPVAKGEGDAAPEA